MRRVVFVFTVIVLTLLSQPRPGVSFTKKLYLPFIKNQGQFREEVSFYARVPVGEVYVSREGRLVYVVREGGKSQLVVEEFTKNGSVKGTKRLEGYLNLFVKGKEFKKIPLYEEVEVRGLAPGITLRLKVTSGSVEKVFYIEGGASTKDIRVRVEGAESLKVDREGRLVIETKLGKIALSKPVAYQLKGDEKEFLKVSYRVYGGKAYGFEVEGRDPGLPLFIDPVITSTYGPQGLSLDWAEDIAVDSSGNVYVVGKTWSSDFPVTEGAAQGDHSGDYDAFVVKFDNDLKRLLAATFIGGTNYDGARRVVVDEEGNVYVAGITWSSDFPVNSTGVVFDGTFNQGVFDEPCDIFVVKLDSSLSQIKASTFLGGSSYERINALVYENSTKSIFVVGATESSDFPVTAGAFDTTFNGLSDAFVAKLDSNLSSLLSSTLLGGSLFDEAYAAALNANGDLVVGGETWSPDFPTTPGTVDTTFNGTADAFVSVLKNDLSALLASTFLGGAEDDTGYERVEAIDVNESNLIYLVGTTVSKDFPFENATNPDEEHMFWAMLNSNLSLVLLSGLPDGGFKEESKDLVVDKCGNIWILGVSFDQGISEVIGSPHALDLVFEGPSEGFLLKVTPNFNDIIHSTFLGGSDEDLPAALVEDPHGNVFVVGTTFSEDFPVTDDAYNKAFYGDSAIFITKFFYDYYQDENAAPIVQKLTADPNNGTAPLTSTLSCVAQDPDGSVVQYNWYIGSNSTPLVTNVCNITYTFQEAGTYEVFLEVVDDGGATANATVTIYVTEAVSAQETAQETGNETESGGGGCSIAKGKNPDISLLVLLAAALLGTLMKVLNRNHAASRS